MYDYKIVEQVTRKKKKLSGALKKTMVFFAVVFVVMGITISQAFMLAGFCLAGLYFIYGTFSQKDYEYTLENEMLTIDVIYGKKYRRTAHELDLRQLEVVAPHWHQAVAKYKKNGGRIVTEDEVKENQQLKKRIKALEKENRRLSEMRTCLHKLKSTQQGL